MKKINCFLSLAVIGAAALLASGCVSAINTKDVTKITTTQTGIKIGQNTATGAYELTVGRSQVEYVKIPTGLNGTNAGAADAATVPTIVSSYEANGHSAVFGNAAVTTTVSSGSNAVATTLGGEHLPINTSTGVSNNLTPLSH